MQRWWEWFRDSEGRGYPGAIVTVYDAGASTTPTLYSAQDDTQPIANPTTTDASGFVNFAIPNGTYDIVFQAGGMPTVRIANLTICEVTGNTISTPNPMTQVGDIIYGGGSGAPTRLAGNTTTTPKYLRQVGTGAAANAPTWTQVPASEVAVTPAGTISATDAQAALAELDSEKLSDAPNDGSYYARRNAAWAAVTPVVDGDKGDITVSGSGASWNIDNAAVTESKLGLSDNTTNDVSTTKHGLTPKAPNDTSKFLRGDATWAIPIATGSLLGYQVFTSNGSYTKATNNPSFVVVEVQGGGAAGGHGGATALNAWGGGAGGYSIKKIAAASLAASETVTVGATVAGRTTAGTGANGNASSFGAFCSGAGGSGGAGNVASPAASGAGGAGSSGDINITGGNGAFGSSTGNLFGGFGGNSKFGFGGYGSNSSGNAQAGSGYGSGGGGEIASSGESSGAGAAGIVIVWEYA